MTNITKYKEVFLLLDKKTQEFVFTYNPSSQPKKALFSSMKHAYNAIKGNEDKYQIVVISGKIDVFGPRVVVLG